MGRAFDQLNTEKSMASYTCGVPMCPARNWTVQMSLFILICERRERSYQQCTINMTGRQHSETEIKCAYMAFGEEVNTNEGFWEGGSLQHKTVTDERSIERWRDDKNIWEEAVRSSERMVFRRQ